jgi:hypothetical protein
MSRTDADEVLQESPSAPGGLVFFDIQIYPAGRRSMAMKRECHFVSSSICGRYFAAHVEKAGVQSLKTFTGALVSFGNESRRFSTRASVGNDPYRNAALLDRETPVSPPPGRRAATESAVADILPFRTLFIVVC